MKEDNEESPQSEPEHEPFPLVVHIITDEDIIDGGWEE